MQRIEVALDSGAGEHVASKNVALLTPSANPLEAEPVNTSWRLEAPGSRMKGNSPFASAVEGSEGMKEKTSTQRSK